VPAPAVVVLQELFGVNADIRKTCNELAEQGFLAVAPDLFWRQEPGVDLSVTSEADWQHGLRLYGAYDRDAGAKDVKDTVNAARSLPECNGRVAVLGYCLGALMREGLEQSTIAAFPRAAFLDLRWNRPEGANRMIKFLRHALKSRAHLD
jgi:hypothetical protein